MSKSTLQTLERGIRVIDAAAASPRGITMNELAELLEVHRTIAYRIVSTLEVHGLVSRPGDNRVYLGSGVLRYADKFLPQLRNLAQPMLDELANETGATSFISVAQGNECCVVGVGESAGGIMRVSYRIGSRHPITLGAAGITILANRPENSDDLDVVKHARQKGYSLTESQIQKGASGIACPLMIDGLEASLGIVTMDDLNVEDMAEILKTYAKSLSATLQYTQQ